MNLFGRFLFDWDTEQFISLLLPLNEFSCPKVALGEIFEQIQDKAFEVVFFMLKFVNHHVIKSWNGLDMFQPTKNRLEDWF